MCLSILVKVGMISLDMVARRRSKGIVMLTVVEPWMEESHVERGHCQVSLKQ